MCIWDFFASAPLCTAPRTSRAPYSPASYGHGAAITCGTREYISGFRVTYRSLGTPSVRAYQKMAALPEGISTHIARTPLLVIAIGNICSKLFEKIHVCIWDLSAAVCTSRVLRPPARYRHGAAQIIPAEMICAHL